MVPSLHGSTVRNGGIFLAIMIRNIYTMNILPKYEGAFIYDVFNNLLKWRLFAPFHVQKEKNL
jgi:hypothetical protein